MAEIAVLNAGGWGTALACMLANRGHAVTLWARRPELATTLRTARVNAAYLPGVVLPPSVEPTADLAHAVSGRRILIVAATSRGLRDLAQQLASLVAHDALILIGTKGLEPETWLRPTQVFAAVLGPEFASQLAVLSGPTHAEEVARGQPTAAVLACANASAARRLQELLSTPTLRLYTSADVVGVELCAAAKNVVALAAGIGDGLGYGDNSKAALITRSLAELGRLVTAYGGQLTTVAGLAGIGDLIATCTSRHSRNRWAGEQLGRGQALSAILCSTPMVVEGVPAARGVVALARAAGVEMPICEAVHRVLYEGQAPAAALAELLQRPLTAELPHPA
ncbi:MAG TPA: NAD(P)H-dependent glycerol-3-phosphate dehydrogenase [Chloroflexota bacterium]|nr:NAD(P)H-dependent glycerol-3-phosphate dehydrogenase [Chloroflexota bacterium]